MSHRNHRVETTLPGNSPELGIVPKGMRRHPWVMKAQSLTMPSEQLDECSIAQGLVTLPATSADKEQMRRGSVGRTLVQRVRANGGQGLRLVKIDDPLDRKSVV